VLDGRILMQVSAKKMDQGRVLFFVDAKLIAG
jgi:hypothetical protein